MSNNMKKAIIYFEGREVCRVEFDSMPVGLYFLKGNEEVASFPETYGYAIIDEKSEEEIVKEQLYHEWSTGTDNG